MFDWVNKGGRKEFTCSKCGKPISKGEPHFTKRGGKDSSRFHEKCLGEGATIGIGKDETKVTPKPAVTKKPEADTGGETEEPGEDTSK